MNFYIMFVFSYRLKFAFYAELILATLKGHMLRGQADSIIL